MTAARTSRTVAAEEAFKMWTPTASSRPSLVEAWEEWEDILAWEATVSNSPKEAMEEDTDSTDRASASSSARAVVTTLQEMRGHSLSVLFDVLCCIIALL